MAIASRLAAARDKALRFPRWQTAVARAVSGPFARAHGQDSARARRVEYWVSRGLGQPLSTTKWNEMTFSDKINYRQLRDDNPDFAIFNDKLRMREFVEQRLGETSLPALVKVAAAPSDLEDLVGPFALKANHGSGWIILVPERRVLTEAERTVAGSWLNTNYGRSRREAGYEHARPLLLVEELLSDPSPPDYKFFCFSGEPEVVLVCFDRMSGLRRTFVDRDWQVLGGMVEPPPPGTPPVPRHLDEMLDMARRLSEGHGFLRVDLYDLADRAVVGELTPYPLAGHQRFWPTSLDRDLGKLWTMRPGDEALATRNADAPEPGDGPR